MTGFFPRGVCVQIKLCPRGHINRADTFPLGLYNVDDAHLVALSVLQQQRDGMLV